MQNTLCCCCLLNEFCALPSVSLSSITIPYFFCQCFFFFNISTVFNLPLFFFMNPHHVIFVVDWKCSHLRCFFFFKPYHVIGLEVYIQH